MPSFPLTPVRTSGSHPVPYKRYLSNYLHHIRKPLPKLLLAPNNDPAPCSITSRHILALLENNWPGEHIINSASVMKQTCRLLDSTSSEMGCELKIWIPVGRGPQSLTAILPRIHRYYAKTAAVATSSINFWSVFMDNLTCLNSAPPQTVYAYWLNSWNYAQQGFTCKFFSLIQFHPLSSIWKTHNILTVPSYTTHIHIFDISSPRIYLTA